MQSEPEKPVDPQPTEEAGVTEGGVNIRVAAVVGTVELALHTKGDTVATVRVEGGRCLGDRWILETLIHL